MKKWIIFRIIPIILLLLICYTLLLCVLRGEKQTGPLQAIVVSVNDNSLILKPREGQELCDPDTRLMMYTGLLKDEESKILVRVLKEDDVIAVWYKNDIWRYGENARIYQPLKIIRVKYAEY